MCGTLCISYGTFCRHIILRRLPVHLRFLWFSGRRRKRKEILTNETTIPSAKLGRSRLERTQVKSTLILPVVCRLVLKVRWLSDRLFTNLTKGEDVLKIRMPLHFLFFHESYENLMWKRSNCKTVLY